MLSFSDVICLSETWIQHEDLADELELSGYQCRFNSVKEERGKGLAIYCRKRFCVKNLITTSLIQVSMVFSNELEIIAIYRSKKCQMDINEILKFCNPNKVTIVCGDMNFCYKEQKHPWIQEFIRCGFKQLVKQSTHILGGHIDQFYIRDKTSQYHADISLYSPYYVAKDHDAICAIVANNNDNRVV